MKRLRIGVIGAGAFGQRHIATIRREPLCELAAIADPAKAAAAFALQNGHAYYASYDDMLANARLDAAIIATPNALHAPTGLACAAHGVHMLIEKPIAETVAAAQRLSEAAEHAGVALLVGHHRRYNPIIAKAREIVQGGGIGRLTAVTALWMLQKPAAYFDVAWRVEPEGGGPILINLVHDIDDLRFICGEIASVQAMTANGARGHAVEDTAVITLRFAGGALGTITVSDAVAAPWSWEITSGEAAMYPQRPENCYLFAGTTGSLAAPKLELWRYAGETGWSAPLSCERLEILPEDPQVVQLRHFCRVIRGEEAPLITGRDATRTLATTLAIREAATTGRRIEFG
ncbi:MAG: Gfo/Idh/MocA family oxidoreductase [Betaproteobacteria bacterium]